MAQRITSGLWFDHTARQAVDLYVGVFPDSGVTEVTRYPTEGLPDFQKEFAGQELEIRFRLAGQEFSALNAGPEFSINPSLSMMLTFDSSADEHAGERLDEIWAALVEDGTVLMELGHYDFSPRYGWLQDRFGMTWQFILSDPAGDPRPFVMPSLMFPHGRAQAGQAIELYTALFEDSGRGFSAPYPAGDNPPGSLMYADFRLAGQWFAAMDAGGPQDFTFNEAVSLIVGCDDQAEIDRLWSALSAFPEAEACGWCKDRFGVSWQIVPRDMGELMSHPGSWDAMMKMGKLVIADFG